MTSNQSKLLPLACSLEEAEQRERQERWARVGDRALIDRRRSASGARLRFASAPDIRSELEELISLEAVCCAFLEFSLRDEGETLVLDVSGPREAASVIDLFAAPVSD